MDLKVRKEKRRKGELLDRKEPFFGMLFLGKKIKQEGGFAKKEAFSQYCYYGGRGPTYSPCLGVNLKSQVINTG